MSLELKFTPIDVKNWDRAEVFYYFSKMAPTGYSLTVDIDVTNMKSALEKAKMKFYPAYLWVVTKALNRQPEFRIAEKEGVLGYYPHLIPLYAVFHDDSKTFSFLWTEYDDNFLKFYESYRNDREKYGDNHGVLAKNDQLPPPNAYTVSCVPWIGFRHFSVHSYENKPYYFPSVEAGKIEMKNGGWRMPLSVTCHHATTDGYHVSRFLEQLQKDIDDFAQYII